MGDRIPPHAHKHRAQTNGNKGKHKDGEGENIEHLLPRGGPPEGVGDAHPSGRGTGSFARSAGCATAGRLPPSENPII